MRVIGDVESGCSSDGKNRSNISFRREEIKLRRLYKDNRVEANFRFNHINLFWKSHSIKIKI